MENVGNPNCIVTWVEEEDWPEVSQPSAVSFLTRCFLSISKYCRKERYLLLEILGNLRGAVWNFSVYLAPWTALDIFNELLKKKNYRKSRVLG